MRGPGGGAELRGAQSDHYLGLHNHTNRSWRTFRGDQFSTDLVLPLAPPPASRQQARFKTTEAHVVPAWHLAAAVTMPRAARNLRVHSRKDRGSAYPATRPSSPPADPPVCNHCPQSSREGRPSHRSPSDLQRTPKQPRSIKPTPASEPLYTSPPVQVHEGSGCAPRSGSPCSLRRAIGTSRLRW